MAESTAREPATSAVEPVVKEVTVALRPERAFALFTDGIDRWWPLATHSVGGREAVACHFEPRVGGRLVEITRDGTRHEWGTILAWEPPTRVALTWHPGRERETAQHLEVTFTPAPGGTRLRLVHRGWERLHDVGSEERLSYDTGWNTVVDRYAAAATGQQTAQGLPVP